MNPARDAVVASIMVSRKKAENSRYNNPSKTSFQGVGFYISIEGPELFVKTIERLGMYVRTQFKISSDVKKCLMQEKLAKLQYPNWQKITKRL